MHYGTFWIGFGLNTPLFSPGRTDGGIMDGEQVGILGIAAGLFGLAVAFFLYNKVNSIKIAVSYTHLTLPTICSV